MGNLRKLVWLLCIAAMMFLAGCRDHEDTAEGNLNLGQRYLGNLEYEEAVIAFSKCIEIDPKCEAAYLGRAQAFAGLEEWALAVFDCKTAMELNEDNEEAYMVLGNILLVRMERAYPITGDEYWDIMKLLQKKEAAEAVGNLISRIEAAASSDPSYRFEPEDREMGDETEPWETGQETGDGENTLWNGKIQVMEKTEDSQAFSGRGDLTLLYVLEKKDGEDHFEIKKAIIEGKPYYVLIYYSRWEESGYKGFGEYQAVLYENGEVRSVLKAMEDANKVGDTGLNIDGRNVYDLDGNRVLKVSERYWPDWGFFHDLCRVYDSSGHLYGYMNSAGEVVIPCRYENTKGFESGAAFSISKGRRGYINTQGEWILDEQYDFIGDETERGLYCVRDRESGKCGYVDASGRFVIPCIYDEAFPFYGKPGDKNHTAIVFSGKAGTIIDDQGNKVLGEEYELAGSGYGYGLFAVRQKESGLYGYANRRGDIKIPCEYDEVLGFDMMNGIVSVRSGGEEFHVDMNNQRAEPVETSAGTSADDIESQYEWRYMMGGGQYAEASTYYVVDYKVYNWDSEVLLEGKEGSSIVVIDGTDFYYDDGDCIYVYRYEERNGG